MRNLIFKIGRVALFAVAILGFVGVANAQTLSNTASVNLSMSISESITVSATPSNITFTYSPSGGGTATASGPITVVTTANLAAGHTYINVYGWLGSTTTALGGPRSIPSSEVFASITGNGTTGWASGSLVPCTSLESIGVSGAGCSSVPGTDSPIDSTRDGSLAPGGLFVITDNVTLSLANLGNLAPGSYTGTINFEADYL